MTPDLILRLDREGRLLFSGATAATGETPTLPVPGESIAVWARTSDDAALWMDAVRRVANTGESVELLVPAPVAQEERFYQGYLSPERQGGVIISLFVVLRDVTPALRREQELSRQNAALLESLGAAQNHNLQSLSLEADLSHELRAPLANIISLLDLLRDSTLTASQSEWVTVAQSSARALLRLINDVLELSLIESRRVRLEPTPLSLADLLRDVVILFARRAQEQNIELIVRIDPALPPVLYGDAGHLRQVLSNLIDNALKFTSQGYVLVDAAKSEETAQRVLLQIEVEDSGAGVPVDRQERIFERFAQGMNGNATEKGSGLGLAISRQLALLMQGSLKYISRPGTGAVFQLSVPLERGDASETPVFQERLKGLGVLIVDNHYLRQCLLYEMAASWGMFAEVRSSLSEMQYVLSRPQHPFDVVLLDDGLSQENLPETLVNFAKMPRFVLLASPLRETHIARRLPVPLAAVVSKPTFTQTLGETLLTLLEPDADVPNVSESSNVTAGQEALPDIVPQENVSEEAAESSEEPTPEVSSEFSIRRVLLIEDEPISRGISREVLERAGYGVTTAGNGKEAFEIARVFDFDLILLDVRLPDTDAITLLRGIKQTETNAATRFVFLTAYSLSELPPDFPHAEVDAVFTKPLTPEALAGLFSNVSLQAQGTATQTTPQETLPKPVLPSMDTPEVLNQELLWERVGKVSGILRTLVALCKAEYPVLIAEMRDALQHSDIPAFQKAAHQIRGMMMSIYADAAAQAIRRYELTVKEEQSAAILSADTALDAEISRLEFALNRLLAEKND